MTLETLQRNWHMFHASTAFDLFLITASGQARTANEENLTGDEEASTSAL